MVLVVHIHNILTSDHGPPQDDELKNDQPFHGSDWSGSLIKAVSRFVRKS